MSTTDTSRAGQAQEGTSSRAHLAPVNLGGCQLALGHLPCVGQVQRVQQLGHVCLIQLVACSSRQSQLSSLPSHTVATAASPAGRAALVADTSLQNARQICLDGSRCSWWVQECFLRYSAGGCHRFRPGRQASPYQQAQQLLCSDQCSGLIAAWLTQPAEAVAHGAAVDLLAIPKAEAVVQKLQGGVLRSRQDGSSLGAKGAGHGTRVCNREGAAETELGEGARDGRRQGAVGGRGAVQGAARAGGGPMV